VLDLTGNPLSGHVAGAATTFWSVWYGLDLGSDVRAQLVPAHWQATTQQLRDAQERIMTVSFEKLPAPEQDLLTQQRRAAASEQLAATCEGAAVVADMAAIQDALQQAQQVRCSFRRTSVLRTFQ
jgi:hypothetical protein